jgi:hypothetical protein
MATIHMILQGKGGVGKSLSASLLTQYFLEQDRPTQCIDTDPVNATLTGYQAFSATTLDIMHGEDVDPRRFDQLVEIILGLPSDKQLVVDNGAATFLPFCSYLAENAVFALLSSEGHMIQLHSVVTGGQAILDTLAGLQSLLRSFEGFPLTVWLNPYFGPITRDGKEFEQFALYKEHAASIASIIRLPNRRKDTFGKDLERLLADRLTFAEASASPDYPIMVRQRLQMLWRDIRDEIERANL